MSIQHFIKAEQLSPEDVNKWIEKAEGFEKFLQEGPSRLTYLRGVTVASLFFEQSTRTRLCLEKAAINLGAIVLGPEDPEIFSAMAPGKEESFEDTIRIISGYKMNHLRIADIIIIRSSKEKETPEIAAEVSAVPILNAGNKSNHPTQALTDLMALKKFLGRLNNLTIAFVGDLRNSRIIEDDVLLLSYYPDFHPIFVSPPELGIRESLRARLIQKGIEINEATDIREVICDCDVGYIVRVQKNLIKDPEQIITYQKNRDRVAVTKAIYDMTEQRGTLFFHPMPVSREEQEIRPEVSLLPRVKMYQQALLKIPIGMVALSELWRIQTTNQIKKS